VLVVFVGHATQSRAECIGAHRYSEHWHQGVLELSFEIADLNGHKKAPCKHMGQKVQAKKKPNLSVGVC
jgi:hypothetical protein